MIRRRPFRPALSDVLESRIALSADASVIAVLQLADVQSAPAAPTSPTYEELTTTFREGIAGALQWMTGKLEQTEYRLTVPTGSNTATTTESINLPGGLGLATVVDVSTRQGNTTTDNITTTLPDGSIMTETKIQNTYGRTTSTEEFLTMPGGDLQTTRGKTIQSGRKTITNDVINTPAGKTEHERTVVIQSSPTALSGSSTITRPGAASKETMKWTTTIQPLAVPVS
jgi:hypothetical protein